MIGIPYAWSCQACGRACVCPFCGAHLPQDQYAAHYKSKHAESDPRPFAGTENARPKFCAFRPQGTEAPAKS